MKASIFKNLLLPGLAIILLTFSTQPLSAQITNIVQLFLCAETTAHLEVQVSNPELSTNYHWDFGDSTEQDLTFPNSPSTIHTYAKAGIYSATFTVTYASGVSYTAQLGVKLNPLPLFETNIIVVKGFLFTAIRIHQSDSSKVDIAQYQVDFGDGKTESYTSSNLPFNIVHNYLTYGKYNLTITAIALGTGCMNSVTKPIILPPHPVPFFEVSNLCQGNATYFYGRTQLTPDTNIIAWNWNFGDTLSGEDNTSTLQNPSHVYRNACTYHVILTVNDYTNIQSSVVMEVIITPTPITNFTCSTRNCDPQTVYFKNTCSTSKGFINVYDWDFGDGITQRVMFPDSPDVSHTYSQPGSYNVTLSIGVAINPGTTDSCFSSVSKQVTTPLLTSHFTFTTPVLNEPVQFTDQSNLCSSIVTGWYWDFGNGNSSTLQNPVNIYSMPGNYVVMLQIHDSQGNSGTVDTVLFIPATGKNQIIKGKVLVGTEIINESFVKLVQINASGFPVSSMTVSPGTDGNFMLENITDGTYYLIAYPKINGMVASKFLPTYYTKSVYWPSATLIDLGEAQIQYDIQLEPYTILKGGNLTINGQLLNSGKSLNPSEQEILLLDNQNNPVRWTFTDEAGKYSFDSLPAGNYRVNPVMSGLTSYASNVDLNESTSPAFIKMTISGQIITGNEQLPIAVNPFQIFPNPAHDYVNVELSGSSEVYTAEIINTSGRTVKTTRLTNGTNTIYINSFSAGLYLIRITDTKGKEYKQRFIKQ